MLKSLRNIQSTFQLMKGILVLVIVACTVISVTAVWKAFEFAEAQRQKIYVLDEGRALTLALAQDVYQNRMAEARAHVKQFHKFFFTLSPSASAIEYNMGEAMKLADNEAMEQYENMKEQGFFQRLIAGGVSCELKVDSIIVDDASYPYYARFYGMVSLIRSSSVTFRNLETECSLINCTRSDDNPHGFIIEKWHIIDNSDIKTVER